MSYDPSKTLDELEESVWGPPTYDSGLVKTCHRLRTKPVKDFTVEDLRIMIGQKIGLNYLIPLALIHLEENPWAEGAFFEGDLLGNVLKCGVSFWSDHPKWKYQLDEVLLKVSKMPTPDFASSDGVLKDIEVYRQQMAP